MPPEQPLTAPTPARRFSWPLLAALLLGLALLAAYANAFRVPFLFDDPSSIADNPTLRSWRTAFLPPSDSGVTVSGRPLLNATFALNWALGRDNVTGYHVVNLLIHFLAALTLFGLTRRTLLLPSLSQHSALNSQLSPASASAAPLALSVSALWALHPLQTESVTYIVQRAESLVGLCYLLTLYCFVRSIDTPASARRWQFLSVLSCLAGMASKEVMASAPLIVLLFDRTFVSGAFAASWRSHKKLHLALAATWLLLAACILSTSNRGGTVGLGSGMSSWHYFLTQCQALVHYLRLAVWPHPLVLDYGTTTISRFTTVAPQFFALLALGFATLWALWKKPVPGFLGAVFFAVLAPTSSFVPVITQTMAEHRMYLALAPLVLLAAFATHRLLQNRALPLFAVIALAFVITTALRNHDYRTAESIWHDTREKAPLNPRSFTNLAKFHIDQKNYPAAFDLLNRALELDPRDANAWVDLANILLFQNRPAEGFARYEHALSLAPRLFDAHYNYGKALLEHRRIDEALAHIQTALEIKPSSTDARHNLGNALAAARRPAEAIAAYEQVLASTPGAIDTRNNLAATLLTLGRAAEAVPLLEENIRLAPNDAPTHLTLGRAHIALNQPDSALADFTDAVRLAPSLKEARANLGHSLLQAGRHADAITQYEAALKLGLDDASLRLNLGRCFLANNQLAEALDQHRLAASLAPASPEIRHSLARLLLQTGHVQESLPHYQKLLSLVPNSPHAHNELGIAFAQLGRISEARAHFEQAVKLAPQFSEARENLARALAQ
jgi:tetratricopeptide (TPR) repeat protein